MTNSDPSAPRRPVRTFVSAAQLSESSLPAINELLQRHGIRGEAVHSEPGAWRLQLPEGAHAWPGQWVVLETDGGDTPHVRVFSNAQYRDYLAYHKRPPADPKQAPVDHSTEAMACATAAYEEHRQGAGRLAELHMAEAQMHATLALAQQQKTANLIALDKVWRITDLATELTEDSFDFKVTRYDLLEEIAAVLGVKP